MIDIYSVNKHNFNENALRLFQFQSKNNSVYAEYLKLIDKKPESVKHYTEIPFLPIQLFKSHCIKTGEFNAEKVFESSTTTSGFPSKHHIKDLAYYHNVSRVIIERQFGNLHNFEIFGLLPNYIERGNSSLVSMVTHFMHYSKSAQENFFLYDFPALIEQLRSSGPKLLFGVSFALLDLAAQYTNENSELIIIETGGMKGRKKEITKAELHTKIKASFPNAMLCSEYGMTELLSQAYSKDSENYQSPEWLKVLFRDEKDHLSYSEEEGKGAINIIDLANQWSCAFIATDDLGKSTPNGFEVLGRMDAADQRGCALMLS